MNTPDLQVGDNLVIPSGKSHLPYTIVKIGRTYYHVKPYEYRESLHVPITLVNKYNLVVKDSSHSQAYTVDQWKDHETVKRLKTKYWKWSQGYYGTLDHPRLWEAIDRAITEEVAKLPKFK